MLNLTLKQLFGQNATQDSQKLIIYKADLPLLTASADNRAEQLLAAVLLQAWNEFAGLIVDETEDTIADETGEAIAYDQRQLYEKLHIWFWKQQFVEGKVQDTFIMDCFIKPPPSYGDILNADRMNYA